MSLKYRKKYIRKYYIDWIHTRVKNYANYTKIAQVIELYHDLAREDLSEGEAFYLRKNLGVLQVMKQKREVEVDEITNTVKNNMPVNWRETWKLWKSHPDLQQKSFVRYENEHSDNYQFRLYYSLGRAKYNNKHAYSFKFNAKLKSLLSFKIKNKKCDAYKLPDYADRKL